jgi:hypothetical protein
VEGLGGGRAPRRRRFEVVGLEAENIATDSESVEDVERVEDVEEEASDVVEAMVVQHDLLEPDKELVLENLQLIKNVAKREAGYGVCLVELREKLRRIGELDSFRSRLIAAELSRVRARLYEIGLTLLKSFEDCSSIGDTFLEDLCERVKTRRISASMLRSVKGSSEPWIVLSLLRRYHPTCYRVVVGEVEVALPRSSPLL